VANTIHDLAHHLNQIKMPHYFKLHLAWVTCPCSTIRIESVVSFPMLWITNHMEKIVQNIFKNRNKHGIQQ